MTSLQVVVVVVVIFVVVAILAAGMWQWYRSDIEKKASRLARQVFPVWAAQGPFESGEESATAMHYAYLAVFGVEKTERMGMVGSVSKHAAAYDLDPEAWEKNRQMAIHSGNSNTEELVMVAKGFAALDALNQDIPEPGDQEFNFGRRSDRSLKPGHKKICTADAVQIKLESTESSLPWSSNPSAHEAHLMRRHNNPYFPKSRRSVSHKDLEGAKKNDRDDYVLCQRQLEEIGQDMEAFHQTATTGDLMALRERIDDLIFFSMGVGGPATMIASKADRFREALVSDLRTAFESDKETLSSIVKADTYHKDNVRKFYIPVVAQMLRRNSPILEEETIATLLSEDPSAIAIFMNSLPEDNQALIELEGLRMLLEKADSGHIDSEFEEKVFALRGEWPMVKK